MSWKDVGGLWLVITAANIAGLLWSQGAKLWVWAAYVGGVAAVGYAASQRSARRIRAVRDAAPADRASLLEILNQEEQALARLAAELVSGEKIQQLPIDGDVFDYGPSPPALHALLFWGCIVMSGWALLDLAVGRLAPDQRSPAFALGAIFAACAWGEQLAQTALSCQVIVTPFGIVERTAAGHRVGILWSEVASIRQGRWLMGIKIRAADGRRQIGVSPLLRRFPQFMELLVSAIKMLEQRAA